MSILFSLLIGLTFLIFIVLTIFNLLRWGVPKLPELFQYSAKGFARLIVVVFKWTFEFLRAFLPPLIENVFKLVTALCMFLLKVLEWICRQIIALLHFGFRRMNGSD